MIFQPKTVDYKLSPYTGLTRESWIEAAQYLLQGIFQHIKTEQDPVVMPRKEINITYPHQNVSNERAVIERKAEIFEGLTRTFFIAAPIIHIDKQIELNHIGIRDYYKKQILRACTKGDANSVGDYQEQMELSGNSDPTATFQQTVETGALVIGLWSCKAEIWDTYTKEEKNRIAQFLLSYGHASTVPQNWRLFNMMVLAFLHREGYFIEKEVMLDHAQAILAYYAGDGWYRDGHSFDYYSCWAFNLYGPLWNLWYGYENAPYIAEKIEEHSNALMRTYADFFDSDGYTNMWGRSNIYRNAATSAFLGNLMLPQSTVDPGLARRICSGSLMQFLTRDDFLYQGIPTLGFYGQFLPLVQGYSCAESTFWFGKAFSCLCLPANHPFWTRKENNGTWDTLKQTETKVTCLDGPALCFSNHKANGETVLRTGKVLKDKNDTHGMWNYSKLCYNTKYPWEASPRVDVEAQQYVLRDTLSQTYEKANVTFWCGEKNKVLYRRQYFNYELSKECHWMHAMTLADFVVPLGVLRVDKLRLYGRPITLTLGSYGFPDQETEIIEKSEGNAKAMILKGHDFTGTKKQMAMTIYDGWDTIQLLKSHGTNPDSENSIVLYAKLSRNKKYGYEPYLLISQVITKESTEDFTMEELFPIEQISYSDQESCGGYGSTTIKLKDGSERNIKLDEIEGMLQL